MIPILVDPATHNKIGYVNEAASATVTEARNGKYEATLTYPITGRFYNKLACESVVYLKPNEISQTQPFRVYKVGLPLSGLVTYNLEHLSYELSDNPVARDVEYEGTPTGAIDALLRNAEFSSQYVAWSDIETPNRTTLKAPLSVRSGLGGIEGSVLDTWGGEYEFDRYQIKLHKHRGHDNGVQIRYRKNLTGFTLTTSYASAYSHVLPYARYTPEDSDTEITVVAPLVDLGKNYTFSRTMLLDLTENIQEGHEVDPDYVSSLAAAYISANSSLGEPDVSLAISFVPLWQTAEYKDVSVLERCSLCDTVTVIKEDSGTYVDLKIVSATYDVLRERYTTMQLGSTPASIASSVSSAQKSIDSATQKLETIGNKFMSGITAAIDNATSQLVGNGGGYVVLRPADSPQEILIMDTPDIATAVRVWRFNSSGLGYSRNGYNGPFELAATMDGAIVADFIRTGTLDVNLIRVGLAEYIRMHDNIIELGKQESKLQARITNEAISFLQSGIAVAYFASNKMVNTDVVVKNTLTFTNQDKVSDVSDLSEFTFVPRANGNLSIKWGGAS